MNTQNITSSRWIQEFEKQLYRRQHIVLYGNIDDQFLWRGSYQGIHEFLTNYFQDLNFQLIVRYDSIDGFTFAKPEMSDRFEQITRAAATRINPQLPTQPAPAAPAAPANPMAPPPRGNPGAVGPRMNTRVSLEDAFGNLRALVSQTANPAAAVVDLADMITSDASRYSGEERNALVLLKKSTLEASLIREGDLAGCRNTLVILARDLQRVPEWLYHNNPTVTLLQVSRPNKDERRLFAQRFLTGFYGGDRINNKPSAPGTPSELDNLAEEFAELTENFRTLELDALRATSWRDRIPVKTKEMWRLIDFYKFGVRDDPWERMGAEKVLQAKTELPRTVIGQPRAVQAVTTMLTTARIGLTIGGSSGRSGKPKGIFFFVGPTGVGKTELAKAMTKLVFGDEKAFARFDMSEYKEEHAAEKLAGAPPGFVGYEEGGQLTNRVMENPHSILLFDEIEKAHPKVLDKFLQILEDGRLTDGKGQTAYFNQTAIIFTSNIGASDFTDPQTGAIVRRGIMNQVKAGNANDFSWEQVENHFRTEVDWHFTSRIGRAELLNRLGDNIVVFDLLRPDFVEAIGDKFLKQLSECALEKYRLTLKFLPSTLNVLRQKMERGDNLLFGGRRIKSLLESLVERPLNTWIFDNFPDTNKLAGQTLEIGINNDETIEVNQN
ncbi:MAG: AAA family ATPase [Microcoleus anatoxicus]|uniref:AAA family ATPase n=1 Tax=Microcoleus anatoxicus TaxID=2705319 RepID=UPI00366DEE33